MANYLYNRYKFTDINTVWTDKENFPNAAILKYLGSYYDVEYILVVTDAPIAMHDDANITGSAFADDDQANGNQYHFVDGVWEPYGIFAVTHKITTFNAVPIWSNTGVLNNSDGTIYLSASEPIPVSEPIDPQSYLMGFRVGQLIRGMR